ncbi:MAG: glutamate-cysteine ligase family protein [Phycisphaerae bacterium]
MGTQSVESYSDPAKLRLFMKAVLSDLRALEKIIADGTIESGVRRIGAEQELFLVDKYWKPAPLAMEVLERLDDPAFTTELARFNLEFNLPPVTFGGDCLRRMEHALHDHLAKVRQVAEGLGARVLLAGILPTLRKSDLGLANMAPVPRYFALNAALKRLRSGAFEFHLTGADELIVRHDTVMLEACNTSCQVHFQVAPDEFPRLYNIAQAIAAPVLAVAANSPILFGRRLWRETRIALFQQAIDTRSPGSQLQERRARVSFGDDWVRHSVLEIFREDIARFRAVMGIDFQEDPFEVLRAGGVPRLNALQLHNGTVYRWNRPCYGICDGKPHLRIENRVLPGGPTVLDEMANAAFWFGLMSGISAHYEDITQVMEFDTASTNFLAAARQGLTAQFTWLDGKTYPAQELICKKLAPLAREGLTRSGIDEADIARYLGVIEQRGRSGKTGAQWILGSMAFMKDRGVTGERVTALTAGMYTRQQQEQPVHDWPLAQLEEGGGWKHHYMRVEQYMTTNLFTVHEDDVIDLVANLMDWRHIRHVPVEDDHHHLVGLVSYRSLLRLLGHDQAHGTDHPVAVRDVMNPQPISIAPETSTLDAIDIMRRQRVACLPVVKDKRLVGLITERDFLDISRQMFETHLSEG